MSNKHKNMDKTKKSEGFLSTILDYLPDAYYLHDSNGNILDINNTFERITGFKKKELIGKNLFKLNIIPESEYSKTQNRNMSGKFTGPNEFTIIKKDKSKAAVSIKTYPVNINKKALTLGILYDIAALKKADKKIAEDRSFLRTLIDNVPDAIWFKDTDSRFVICNKKTAIDLGKEYPQEIIGKSDFDLLPEDIAESLYKEEQKILKTGKPQINKEIPSRDKKKWGLNTKIPLKDTKGNIIGLLGINRDIAKQKTAEIELQQYKDHLEKIVEARTRELEQANIQLKIENLERKKVENELKHRIKFEQLIKKLSTGFINLTPDEIDEGVNEALEEIGEFLGADRSYVFLFHEDGTKMSNTNEWCAKGIEQQISKLQDLPPTMLPWFFNKISSLEDIFIPKVGKLPLEASIEKQHFQEQKIKSVAALPLAYFGKTLLGFFGIDSVKKEKEWSEDEIELLKISGEFFASAIERKKTLESLRKSESMLQLVLDNIPQRIFWKDKDSVYLGCNKRFAIDAGVKAPEEVVGKTDYDLAWKTEEADLFIEWDKRVMYTNTPEYHIIEPQLQADGKQAWLDTNKIPLHNSNGDVIGILGTYSDITEKFKIEQVIQESEERFRELAELLPEIVFEMNKNGTLTYVNRKAYEKSGYSKEDFAKGFKSFNFLIEDDRKRAKKNSNKALKGEDVTASEYTALKKDGSTFPVLVTLGPIYQEGKISGLRGIVFDITEHKKSENLTQALYNISKAVHSTTSLDELFVSIHNSLNKILDTKNFYIALYNRIKDLITFTYWTDEKDDFPEIKGAKESGSLTAEVINTKKPLLIHKDDLVEKFSKKQLKQWGEIPEVWLGVPLKIKNNVIGVIAVQSYTDPSLYSKSDIRLLESVAEQVAVAIERKRSEEALKESEEKYRHLIEQSNDAIYLLYNRKFVLINRKFNELFGVDLEKVNSPEFDFINLVAPKSRDYIEERNKRIEAGEKVEPRYEFTAIDKNGIEIEVETSVSYVKYGDGLATQGILRDITERKKAEAEKKKLEERLFHAHKMESIGRLAGGIAHDFINSLTIIKGHTQLLEMKLYQLNYDDDSTVEIIVKEIEKAKKLTRQLLDFAKKSEFHPEKLNVNTIIKDTVLVMKKILEENIDIDLKLGKKIKIIEGDKNQLNQVMTNIIINAKDAMPEGGKLTIKTECILIDKNLLSKHPEIKEGEYVKTSIEDSGTGMTKKVKENIFEPFFTTKEQGKGSGLGLAAVYGIIKNHQGYIYCTTKRKKGTTFTIFLPVIK